MVLLDHFHPPLVDIFDWSSLHTGWAVSLAAYLNQHLPQDYYAAPTRHFGVELDVAVLDSPLLIQGGQHLSEVATAPYGVELATSSTGAALSANGNGWVAPPPVLSIPFSVTAESNEVLIYYDSGGRELVGAIELVSPANKDRAEHRTAFVSKCETLLRQGVGLVIVDVVTSRKANLHNELMRRIEAPAATRIISTLYATSYRVVTRHDAPQLDLWRTELAVGEALPIVPLWLRYEVSVPVALGETYERTCREQRIPDFAKSLS